VVGHDHPPAYRFNAGQKAIYWLVVIAGMGAAITGYLLMFLFYGTEIDTMESAEMAHGIIAMLFTALILAHIYIGTIGMEGAFEAMGSGSVDLNWAKDHHGSRRNRPTRGLQVVSRTRPPPQLNSPQYSLKLRCHKHRERSVGILGARP
jgi:formate dehydrogenase subunit gamma